MLEKEGEKYRQLYWLIVYKWVGEELDMTIHCLHLPYTKRENMEDVEMDVKFHDICELKLDSEHNSEHFAGMQGAKLKVFAY